MTTRPRIRLLAFLGVSFLLLFTFAPVSADRPPEARVRLRVPSAVAKGRPARVGVELANDLRARLRNGGGRINVEWRSSRGHGCLTRTAGTSSMDATFDLTGLDAGAVTLSASVTTGTETFASAPVTSTVFNVSIEPPSQTVPGGGSLSFRITLNGVSDQSLFFAGGYIFEDSTTHAPVLSGDFAAASFVPDGDRKSVV